MRINRSALSGHKRMRDNTQATIIIKGTKNKTLFRTENAIDCKAQKHNLVFMHTYVYTYVYIYICIKI